MNIARIAAGVATLAVAAALTLGTPFTHPTSVHTPASAGTTTTLVTPDSNPWD